MPKILRWLLSPENFPESATKSAKDNNKNKNKTLTYEHYRFNRSPIEVSENPTFYRNVQKEQTNHWKPYNFDERFEIPQEHTRKFFQQTFR